VPSTRAGGVAVVHELLHRRFDRVELLRVHDRLLRRRERAKANASGTAKSSSVLRESSVMTCAGESKVDRINRIWFSILSIL
jgi:hypothetical protein